MKLKCQMPLSAVIHNVQLGELRLNSQNKLHTGYQGWRMVKSETRRDAEILVKNPSPRPFGENFRDSKKGKQTLKKRDFETYQKCFRDFEILPKFSETHVFRGTIRHPCYWQRFLLRTFQGYMVHTVLHQTSKFASKEAVGQTCYVLQSNQVKAVPPKILSVN